MILPILIKKKDGYYLYDSPDTKADNVTGIVVGPESGHLRVCNAMYDVTRVLDNELKSLNAVKVDARAVFTLPKVDFETARIVLSFLREVYKEHKAEGAVLLVLNRNHPLENQKYRVVVPKQEVSGGAVDYKDIDQIELKDGEFLAGSIHSHPNFGAFQSGTDHKDEINFDGLHITYGYIDRPMPEIHTRVCFAGRAYEKLAEPMIDLMSSNTPKIIEGLEVALEELVKTVEKNGRKVELKEISKAIAPLIQPKGIDDVEFDKTWLDQVKAKYKPSNITSVYPKGGYNYSGYRAGYGAHDPYQQWLDRLRNGSHVNKYRPTPTIGEKEESVDDIIKPSAFCNFLNRHVAGATIETVSMVRMALEKIEPTHAQIKTFHKSIGEV